MCVIVDGNDKKLMQRGAEMYKHFQKVTLVGRSFNGILYKKLPYITTEVVEAT